MAGRRVALGWAVRAFTRAYAGCQLTATPRKPGVPARTRRQVWFDTDARARARWHP